MGLKAGQPPVNGGGVGAGFRSLDPAKYTSLGDFINTGNKEDNRDLLVKTYGNQGITGFLQMTGAVKASGTNDEVQYWEESRLHSKVDMTLASAASGASSLVATIGTAATDVVRENDVVLINGSVRCIVDKSVPAAAASATLFPLAGTFGEAISAGAQSVPVIGNLHAQGSDQPGEFIESNVVRRTNPYMILKETFKVSGPFSLKENGALSRRRGDWLHTTIIWSSFAIT